LAWICARARRFESVHGCGGLVKIYIVSGLPGSGKTRHTLSLAVYDSPVICSTDDYTMRNGPEKFNSADLPEGHRLCFEKYIETIHDAVINKFRVKAIIVDNTNLTAAEIAPYVAYAGVFKIQPTILRVHARPEVAFKRQTHGVPFDTFCSMVTNWNKRDVMPWWQVVDVGCKLCIARERHTVCV
jgi:tRNA uridine 5-carbamoylmethylation protein Kti12